MVPKGKRLLLFQLQERQPGWCIRTIDLEKSVYRAIGPYGIEISGATKHPCRFHINVRKKNPTYSIIEHHPDLDPRRIDVVSLAVGIANQCEQKALAEGTYIKPPPVISQEVVNEIPF